MLPSLFDAAETEQMETTDLKEITERIISIVNASVNRRITGVRLGVEVRKALPLFSPAAYGCRNLTQFIAKHIPGIAASNQSGPDITFGMAGDVVPAPTKWKIPTQAWRTFTTPRPRYALFANPVTFDVTTFRPSLTVPPPWVHIKSVTEPELLQIAKNFIATVPDLLREPLEKALGDQQWWFLLSLEARKAGFSQQWNTYRHQELFKRLLAMLDAAQETTADCKVAPIEGLVKKNEETVPHGANTLLDAAVDSTSEEVLRRVVLAVVGRMAAHELSELRLPVGDVIAALQAK